MKKAVIFIAMLLAVDMALGLTVSIDEFDDGVSSATLTANATHNLSFSFPVKSATISLISKNISTVYDTNSTAFYTAGTWTDPTYVKDGNTATCADISGAFASNIIEYNLTDIPTANVYAADVHIWDESPGGGDTIVQTNFSIPSSCFITASSRYHIQFRIQGDASDFGFNYYCRNASNAAYVLIADHSTNNEDKTCEAKIRWFESVSNPKVYVNNSLVYSYSGVWIGENLSVNLNYNNIFSNNLAQHKTVSVRIGGNFGPTSMDFSNLSVIYNNSIIASIKDEQTDTFLSGSSSLTFIGSNYSSTVATTNGSQVIEGVPSGDYEIRYSKDGYNQRSYYVTLTNNSIDEITLYLLNSSEGTYNSLQVVDESANVIEDATVKMQREYVSGDTAVFRTVEMTKTDERGKSFLFPQLYDATYRFVIEYDGAVKKTTDKTELDTRDLYFKVTLLDTGISDFYGMVGLGYTTSDLSFNSSRNIWTFTFNDATNSQVSSGRLVVTKRTIYSDTEIYDTTLNGSSGAISYNQSAYRNQTGEFIAVGYINTPDGNSYVKDTESYSYQNSHLTFGLTGVLMSLLLILVFAAIGTYNPSAAIGMCLVGMAIAWFLGLWYIRLTWLVGLVITGLLFMQGTKT